MMVATETAETIPLTTRLTPLVPAATAVLAFN